MVFAKKLTAVLSVVCLLCGSTYAMDQDYVARQENCPLYVAPLRIAQKLVAVSSRPLGYDQAARLPGEEPLSMVMAMIDHDQQFIGLLIDPKSKTNTLVEYFGSNQRYSLFQIHIGILMAKEPIDQALKLMVKSMDQQMQDANRPIIIMQNIEKLSEKTLNSHAICRTLVSIINACHQNIKVSIIGIADNLPMVPMALHKMFALVIQLPAMAYSERRNFLEANLTSFSPPRLTQEWQHLLPLFRGKLSQLDREQFLGTIAQQTEGYSIAALEKLIASMQAASNAQDAEQVVQQALIDTTNRFSIFQTVGAKFILTPLIWISRPSLWLRYLAFSNNSLEFSSRLNILKIANHAQYGCAKPTICEQVKDLALAIPTKLVLGVIKKSFEFIWKCVKK